MHFPPIKNIFLLCLLLLSCFFSAENKGVLPSWVNDKYPFEEKYGNFNKEYDIGKAGCYAIGNGLVFSAIGDTYPINGLSNVCGPIYTLPFFSGEAIEVFQNGGRVDFSSQGIRWVKGRGIVVSTLSGEGLEITTVDFAPPNIKALLRYFTIKNISGSDGKKIKISFRYLEMLAKEYEIKRQEDNSLFVKQAWKEPRYYKLGVLNSDLSPVKDNNRLELNFELKAGEEYSALRYIVMDTEKSGTEKTEKLLNESGTLALFESTRTWWDDWMKNTVQVDTPDKKVDYILETQKIIIKTQQAGSGVFCPMNGYAYTWVRDNCGPVLYMLRIGKQEEVKNLLEFYYRVASNGMYIGSSIPVNHPSSLKENENPKKWSEYGTLPAEIPSLLLLQHLWYYKYSGDLAFMKDKFEFLKQLLDGQDIGNIGLMKFSNDETYMFTLQVRSFNFSASNNYFLGKDAYSADSAFLFIAASEQLAKVADELKLKKESAEIRQRSLKVRSALDRYFWMEKEGYYAPALSIFCEKYIMPHANIGLNPLWCGFAGVDDNKVVSSTKKQIEYLLKENNLMKTNPATEIFSGLLPGMLLYNGVKMRDPETERYLEGLLKCASPSGDFFELYEGNGTCQIIKKGYYCPGRLRPWEGGIAGDALLYYLTGMESEEGILKLRPSIPGNGESMTIKGLCFKDAILDLTVKEEIVTSAESGSVSRKRKVIITNRGTKAVKVLYQTNIKSAFLVSGNFTGDASIKEEVEFLKELRPAETAEEELVYTVKEEKQIPVKPAVYKKPWLYNPPGDIVLFTVNDKSIYYLLSKNNKVIPFDMQYSFSGDDIYNAVYDDKNKALKTKLVIFGPSTFSIGPHHWKNYSFWNCWETQNAFTKFIEAGGIILILSEPSIREGYEVTPRWLEKLLNGGKWKASWKGGRAMASDDFTDTTLKSEKTDSFNFYNAAQRKEKKAVIYSKIGKDGEGVSEKPVSDKKYSGYCEFEMSTAKGIQHSILVKAPGTVSSYDLNLEVKTKNGFVRLAQGKKSIKDKHLEINYILSPQYVYKDKITLRIGDLKSKNKITFSLVEISKLIITGKNPLAEVMGFKAGEIMESPIGSLTYEKMTAPIRLVDNEKYAVIVMKKAGNGIIIRSQLKFSNLRPVIFNLMNEESRGKILKYLAKSSKNETK